MPVYFLCMLDTYPLFRDGSQAELWDEKPNDVRDLNLRAANQHLLGVDRFLFTPRIS